LSILFSIAVLRQIVKQICSFVASLHNLHRAHKALTGITPTCPRCESARHSAPTSVDPSADGIVHGSSDLAVSTIKQPHHFNVPVKAGGTLLQPGMYQIQHASEGSSHVVTFKQMEMPAGYRHNNTPVSKETSTRVICKVEPVDKKVSNTKITLRTNAACEKEIAEVQVAGEGFKHLL
jgi:hypothetical protein